MKLMKRASSLLMLWITAWLYVFVIFKGKEVIDLLQKFETTDADHHTQVEVSLSFFAYL